MTVFELGFMRPERLWALWALPVLLGVYGLLLWRRRSRRRQTTNLDVLFPRRRTWIRHISVVAAVLSLGSLALAWAMPNGYVEVPRQRATIFLVIDVSRSMAAEDVSPTRLDAAQTAAKEFVAELPAGFNVCLISFAGTATLLVSPTENRDQVNAAIDALKLAPATAIGDAIYAALDARVLIPPDPDSPDDPLPAAIVLLSDGATTMGRTSGPAAEQAGMLGLPISTIAFGTPYGVIEDRGFSQPVPVDRDELARVAKLSGGKAYSAESLDQLRDVYSNISRSVGYERVEQEVTERFVGYAVVLAVAAAAGIISLGARWP
ncbi:MAG: VWA domain-containing protein [Propionibacteriaceae bacterium]|jgi:Ca-activated chloride channel family protein|nr:VWA domain-containing protein [Propionibacteriaceae bacterium]